MSGLLSVLPVAPWGGLLSVYFVLVGMAAGTSLLAHLVPPRTGAAADVFVRRACLLALAALFACAVILIADLGQPARFGLMLTRFAPSSVMSWGAKLLALEAALLGVQVYLLGRRTAARAAGDVTPPDALTKAVFGGTFALLLLTSAALAAYPAVLLARTWSSPLAASGFAFASFLVTAALMGAAVCLLLARRSEDKTLQPRLRRVLLALLPLQAALLVALVAVAGPQTPSLARAGESLVRGTHAPVFWGAVVLAGLGLPLWALTLGRRLRHAAWGTAALVLVGASAARYLLFVVRA